MDTILRSAEKTGNVVVVDSAWTNCGASAEILARISESGSNVSVARMGFAPTTCPTTRCLEDLFYPNPRSIATFVNGCLGGAEDWVPAEVELASDQFEFKGPF
jgi:pyruvate dehydrogenase E1 component beta subunit